MVMLAKGNRSKQVTDACKKHGGFYLGSIGGPAARLAQDCIRKVEVLEYPELGMEAVWKIEVEDFPAFIVVDDKGNDFFAHPGAVNVTSEKLPGPLLQRLPATFRERRRRDRGDREGHREHPNTNGFPPPVSSHGTISGATIDAIRPNSR